MHFSYFNYLWYSSVTITLVRKVYILIFILLSLALCVCEEEAEKGLTTGWSLHVNGSDSKIERESEVVSKASLPNGLCQCAGSMLGADRCPVQLRKPGSTSLSGRRSWLLLSATSCHVDVRLACAEPRELTGKQGLLGLFLYWAGVIRWSRERRGALWKETESDTFGGFLAQVSAYICLFTC